jgi:LysM repeat protein
MSEAGRHSPQRARDFAFRSRDAIIAPVGSPREEDEPRTRSQRFCPHCGERVSWLATDCFQCGASLNARPRRPRPVRLPWAGFALLLVIGAILMVWWIAAEEAAQAALTPTPTATPSSTATATASATTTATPTITPTPTLTPTPIVHQVESGESPLFIAGLYGVTLESLLETNGLEEGDLIRVGESLRIPTATPILGPDGLPMTPPPTPTPDVRAVAYTVQAGDTLAFIAARFGVTVEAIQEANGLEPDAIIRPNQPLLIPPASAADQPTPGYPPTATPTAGPPWPAPDLLSPPANGDFGEGQPILLRWAAVGLLGTNEWYVVRVWNPDASTSPPLAAWTKGTSCMVPDDWDGRPTVSGQGACWQVTVVEGNPEDSAAAPKPASPPSAVRCFTISGS